MPSVVRAASDPERMFVASLPLVDRILAIQARRHGLSAADTEEFAAWAKARLIDGEYAVFRKFGGRSSMATYLSVVLHNLFRDYRNSRWGRWRPSAAATRMGPVAIRLEELLYRDGHPLREAVELLRASGVALREGELVRMAARLPQRQRDGEVSLERVAESTPGMTVEPPAAATADTESVRAVQAALRALVDELPPEDALIVRMRFWDDVSVADIARTLRLDQRRLYPRLDAIKARLRAALEARGVDAALVSEIVDGGGA